MSSQRSPLRITEIAFSQGEPERVSGWLLNMRISDEDLSEVEIDQLNEVLEKIARRIAADIKESLDDL